jgi:hypothetical protein
MVIRSWRQQAVDRLDDFCGLNPTAIGADKQIRREPMPFWRNRSETVADKKVAKPAPRPRKA